GLLEHRLEVRLPRASDAASCVRAIPPHCGVSLPNSSHSNRTSSIRSSNGPGSSPPPKKTPIRPELSAPSKSANRKPCSSHAAPAWKLGRGGAPPEAEEKIITW